MDVPPLRGAGSYSACGLPKSLRVSALRVTVSHAGCASQVRTHPAKAAVDDGRRFGDAHRF